MCALQSEGLFIYLVRIIKRVNNQLNHLTCAQPITIVQFSFVLHPLMSISPALRTATRSAYRDVLRAAFVTFAGNVSLLSRFSGELTAVIGDPPVLRGHFLFFW